MPYFNTNIKHKFAITALYTHIHKPPRTGSIQFDPVTVGSKVCQGLTRDLPSVFSRWGRLKKGYPCLKRDEFVW